ncbi:hypothetical protein BGX28_004128 [Mortierella sp. GBA30]|nr:hypothetical protein BGX28_004128 [Mortierella sp. GBA30]
MLSWIRSSEAQASSNVTVGTTDSNAAEDHRQEDWVVLPSDHTDLMEGSVSDLDLLSQSLTLYRTTSSHPASSRTRTETSSSSASALAIVTATATATASSADNTKKSRRQLKQEKRQQQALEELERRPRYDPMIAKMRDQEFKMAKMAKLGMRSGRP